MVQDLHAHTYYSFDCNDSPEKVILAAINGGVKLLGICDHNHGVGLARREACYNQGTNLRVDYDRTLRRYYDHMLLLKEKYRNRLKILCGIEVATVVGKDNYALPDSADISFFDYCLIEGLDKPDSITNGDLFSFAERCGCPAGIAHTDLFAFLEKIGEEPYRYLREMAARGVFWELNVNFDSSHAFRTHDYVAEFFKNKRQQEIVKRTGVKLSVGFDSHAIREYKPARVQNACKLVKDMGIRLAFEGV